MQRSEVNADTDVSRTREREMVTLLGQRFGDGQVYLRGSNDRWLLHTAMERGLIDRDGYLTARGRRLLDDWAE